MKTEKSSVRVMERAAGVALVAISVIASVFSGNLYAQNRQEDYSLYPTLRFRYRHLQVKLKIDPSKPALNGEAIYTLQPILSGTSEIMMYTFRTDIQSVTIDGHHMPYEIHDDTLHIHLSQPYPVSAAFDLSIAFVSQPHFGIHWKPGRLIWTSLLPFSTSHLFPILEHPRITCPVDMTISTPEGFSVVSNGRKESERVQQGGLNKISQWQTDTAIPVTDINFAVGKFSIGQKKSGDTDLSVYALKGILTKDQENALLNSADSLIRKTSEELQQPFPYHDLNIVVLPDHAWEEKTYAATYGYIFLNGGDLDSQLRRIVYAQWFGVKQRSSQYAGAAAQFLLQAWLSDKNENGINYRKRVSDDPAHAFVIYDLYGRRNWLRWRLFVNQGKDSVFKKILDGTVPALAARSGVMNWDDYARYWYLQSGLLFRQPTLPQPTVPDTLNGVIRYTYDSSNRLKAIVDTLKGHFNTLINLPIYLYTASGMKEQTLTFARTGDVAYSAVIPGLKNVSISVPDTLAMKMSERKPLNFWLYQLDNGSTTTQKVNAAKALGSFKGDPDLQLALQDALGRDSLSAVRAALIGSMGDVINGAMGTADDFVKYSRSNDPQIKISALKTLSHYPGNQEAADAVVSLIRKEKQPQILNTAFRTLERIASGDEFRTTAIDFLRSDSTRADTVTATILHTLAQAGDSVLVDTLAMRSLLWAYSGYNLRLNCLALLARYDHNSKDWLSAITTLVSDNDPRIRYMAWKHSGHLKKADRAQLINDQLAEEDDLRVLNEIKRLVQ